MKILVFIKQVPASNEVDMDEETGVLKRDGASAKINPFDLFALEFAFRLKEEHGGTVTAISMGPPQAKDALTEAVQMGADGGMLLSDPRFAGADVYATSFALSQGVKSLGNYDLILCGKQTTDGDTAQVGAECAELLNIPHACYVQTVEVSPECDSVTVQANLGDVLQTLKLPFPCLITLEKDIVTPRLPSFVRSQTIGEDVITVMTMDDLEVNDETKYGLSGSPTQVEKIFPPPQNTEKELVTGDTEEVSKRAFEIFRDGKFI